MGLLGGILSISFIASKKLPTAYCPLPTAYCPLLLPTLNLPFPLNHTIINCISSSALCHQGMATQDSFFHGTEFN
jgi:hypothetical protein